VILNTPFQLEESFVSSSKKCTIRSINSPGDPMDAPKRNRKIPRRKSMKKNLNYSINLEPFPQIGSV
jgi:hypothetical protein